MKKRNIIFLALFLGFLNTVCAQNMKCNIPNYTPKRGEAHLFVDTCFHNSYLYAGAGEWECLNNLVQESTPVMLIDNVKIQYRKVAWYKPSTQNWHDVVNGVWRSRTGLSVDSLLGRHNTWTGKNTFQDSLITNGKMVANGGIKTKGLTSEGLIAAKNGLNSDSTITSKGLNTEGGATKAALKLDGVMSEADTLITTTNYQTDGRFGTYTVVTTDGSKTIKLPPVSNNENWVITIKNEATDNATTTLTINNSAGAYVYALRGKIIAKFKIKNNSWKKESVTFY